MPSRSSSSAATGLFLLVTACGLGVDGAPTSEPTSTATDASPSDTCAPYEALAELDSRKGVPLQPRMAWHQKQNMMDHLVVIHEVIDGVAREDWEAVARSSSRIESSPQMAQTCEHMGAGADGFTEMALDFHRRADGIGVAARTGDKSAVLAAVSRTLAACTACHATYRQDVVDAPTWQARTGSEHDVGSGHGGH